MKNKILLLVLLSATLNALATDRLTFKVSKPVCVLTFLQAANGNANMSRTLTEYIWKHVAGEDSAKLYSLATSFARLDLSTSYNFSSYPENRQRPKTVLNLLTIAAVQSGSVKEFTERIIGVLPNDEWMQIKSIFTESEKYYDKMIGAPYDTEIKHQVEELSKYTSGADSIFNKLKQFYGSTWCDDIPFTVSIYPVPGRRGMTTATPHSNSLVLAVFTKEGDHAMRMGVAFHEICHVLYDEQSLVTQQKLDTVFLQSTSAFSKYAYSYFDEAVATACGNGWAYKALTGEMDKTAWYNDDYINGYAHAIYPMVAEYIELGKPMDKAFIENAVGLFEKKFSKAAGDFKNIFNSIHLYTDADNNEQFGDIASVMRKYFRISSMYSSFPISDPQSLEMMGQSDGSQFFIVHTKQTQNYKILSDLFPQLANSEPSHGGITCFFDRKKRPIIIVNIADISKLDYAIGKLAKKGEMSAEEPFIPID